MLGFNHTPKADSFAQRDGRLPQPIKARWEVRAPAPAAAGPRAQRCLPLLSFLNLVCKILLLPSLICFLLGAPRCLLPSRSNSVLCRSLLLSPGAAPPSALPRHAMPAGVVCAQKKAPCRTLPAMVPGRDALLLCLSIHECPGAVPASPASRRLLCWLLSPTPVLPVLA